jgi:RNA polymerase sigma factor (sigma-70 family)
MGPGRLNRVVGHLRQALSPPDGGGLSDGQLLARFIDNREEAAFAALVRRHGGMVLGVCRRVLAHAHDAEDAFQATFLVLARKAASVAKREALASFLYGVAYRTALRARVRASRRRATERQVKDMPHPEVAPAEPQDWRPLLDRELDALPDKYRAPIVLCDLEGKTRREAARQLGLSEGTLSSQLTRGRRLLARRLARQGVSLSGGALAVALSEGAASAAMPAPLVSSTVKAAALVAAGQVAAVATPAAALMNEVLKAMLMTKLKFALAAVMMAALLGTAGLLYQAVGQGPAAADKRAADRPLTELELLRREVEILKLQMEVMQSELRALKGRGPSAPARAGEADSGRAGTSGTATEGPAPHSKWQKMPGEVRDPAVEPKTPGDRGSDSNSGPLRVPRADNTMQEVEADLLRMRELTSDSDKEMRATLDRVLQRLREQARTKRGNAPPPQYK